MKLLADECCDAPLVAALRTAGHDVRFMVEEERGLTDDEVLGTAFAEGRIVLTEDKDFGDLVVRLRRPAIGVILLRLDPSVPDTKQERLLAVLSEHAARLVGHYVVVHESRIRIRALRSENRE